MSKYVALIALPFLLSSASARAVTAPELEIRAVQDTFVLNEPVRLTCTLKNPSDSTIQIMDVQQYSSNMKHMYYVVREASGNVEYRRSIFWISTGFYMSGYVGEPLTPGSQLEFFLYPAITSVFDLQSGETVGGGNTFSNPGKYQLQLAHFIPRQLPKLWAGTSSQREIVSHPIEIVFVDGTEIDEVILSVLWSQGGGSWLSEGDDQRSTRSDDENLRKILKRYPNARMSKYVYFALARSLLSPSSFDRKLELKRTKEAVGYLEVLRRRDPNFRPEEVAQHLGDGYAYLGESDKAQEVFDDVMQKYPLLSTHYQFTATRLSSLYPTQHAVREWLNARQRGEPYVEPTRASSGH